MTDQDADYKREFLAISEKDIFEEARDRYQIALDAASDFRNKAKGDALFREGEQWGEASPVTTASSETPELTINFTDTLATRVVNNIKQQRPRGKCHPVSDGARIELADVINGIGRHVEYRSSASVAYDRAADDAVTTGEGYFRILSEFISADSFDQDIRILPIFNACAVLLDADSMMPDGSDSVYGFISSMMKRTEYKRRYPRMPNSSWADDGGSEYRMDWDDKENIRLAEYFRIRERAATLWLLRNSQGEEFARFKADIPGEKPEETLALHQIALIDQRESCRRQVEWFRLNGTRVVDRNPLPGSWIPIIRVSGNMRVIDGKVYRRGMVRNMKDPARMVNYGEVAKIRRLGLTPQSPWVAAEGQLDGHPEWTSSNREPVMVLVYKPVTITTAQGEIPLPPPQRTPPAQLEAGFAEFTQGMRSNLLAIANMTNEPGQDTSGQVVSGRALEKRQGQSDQGHIQYYDNLGLSIAHCWRIMLEYIPHYISTERMQRIIGEDGVPSMVKVNEQTTENGVATVKNDLSVGKYDVVMDTGPGYETKREEGAQNLISLMSIPELAEVVVKVGSDLIFRAIDAPYMQELADRIASMTPEGLEKILEQLPERAQQIVKSMGAQIQQLQQELQKVQQDLKLGLTKAHLSETVKAHGIEETNKTKRLDTETRADTEKFKAVLGSHTTLAKEEIAAGASLLNTHVEAKYHEREADRIIETAESAEA